MLSNVVFPTAADLTAWQFAKLIPLSVVLLVSTHPSTSPFSVNIEDDGN